MGVWALVSDTLATVFFLALKTSHIVALRNNTEVYVVKGFIKRIHISQK